MQAPSTRPGFSLLDHACRIAVVTVGFFFVAATAADAATFFVTTTDDELDASSADGSGVSLREAIRDANATTADDTIVLPAGTYALSFGGAAEDGNATGDLDVVSTATGGTLTVIGAGAVSGATTIDADGLNDRIFHALSGANLTLRGLDLVDGSSTAAGGAVRGDGTALTVEKCRFISNHCNDAGGAIFTTNSLTIEDSTFDGNTSGNSAGAIFCLSATIRRSTFTGNQILSGGNSGGAINFAAGTIAIENCTFGLNSSITNGGAIYLGSGTLEVRNSTFTDNVSPSGAGIFRSSGTLTLVNTIAFGNSGGDDVEGDYTANGKNIVGSHSGGTVTNPGNVSAANPLLGSLADNGGGNWTSVPNLGSPAIDPAGGDSTSPLTTDQRGATRVNGGIVDIGAVERDSDLTNQQLLAFGDDIVVMNNDDSGPGSLRQALADAAVGSAFGTHITFADSLGGATITLGGTQLAVADNVPPLDVDASALAGGVTISGNDLSRVLQVGTGADVTLRNLTVTGGHAPDGTGDGGSGERGGGIFNTGALTLVDCAITGNRSGDGADGTASAGDGGFGGGINSSAGTLTAVCTTITGNRTGDGGDASAPGGIGGLGGKGGGVAMLSGSLRGCTISGNRTGVGGSGDLVNGFPGDGGGLFCFTGSTQLTECTISGNVAGDSATAQFADGGGIHSNGGQITAANCTISGNRGIAGAGILLFGAARSHDLTHVTLSNNTAESQGGGIFKSTGTLTLTNSIVAGNTAPTDDNIFGSVDTSDGNNITSGDPMLASLGDYGGKTETMPPLPGSTAKDQADGAFATAADQRGIARDRDFGADIGAVETEKSLYPRLLVENGGSVFTVTKTSDSGAGSLRQAIADANAVAAGPGALILITSKVKKPIALTSGQLLIDNTDVPVVIMGGEIPRKATLPVETANQPSVSGSNLSRVFEIGADARVLMCNLIVRDGALPPESTSGGGGILNFAELTLEGVTVTMNRAADSTAGFCGGGIFNSNSSKLALFNCAITDNRAGDRPGPGAGCGGGLFLYQFQNLILSDCSITDNFAGRSPTGDFEGFGGGISGVRFGNIAMTNCTISGNRAKGGGGLSLEALGASPVITLDNCTVSGNEAEENGAAILLIGTVNLSLAHSTIVDNHAKVANGGVDDEEGFVTVTNSILANNTAPAGSNFESAAGADTFNGVNLIGGDPQLAALDNYGGLTETMPPLPGSLALDTADAGFAPAGDQRGTARKRGIGFDIGAVEVEDALLAILTERGTTPGSPATPPTETGSDDLAAAAGNFSGLITDLDGNITGKIDFRLKADGSFSASGNFSPLGARISVRGTLDGSGTATFLGIAKAGSNEFPFEVQLVMTDNGFRLDGTLDDGSEQHFFDSDRAAFDRRNPSPFAGKFTALIPADPSADTPRGDGFLVLTSGVDGRIRALGALGDNTRLTLNTWVSADGIFPLFAEVYRTKPEKGRIGGMVTFRDVPNVSDFDGQLFWKKLPNARDRLFAEGFESTPTIIGSVYREQPIGTPILPSIVPTNEDNATWLAGFGGVALPGEKMLTWDGRNRVTATLESDERLRIIASSRSGLMRGDYSNRGTGTRIRFYGVAFQKQELIAGAFPGNGETGFLSIQSTGLPTLEVTDLGAATTLVDGGFSDFGVAGVDGGVAERNFQITNTGDGGLLISSLSIEDGKPFAIVTQTESVIPPGGSSVFKVRFQPTTEILEMAELTIASNDAGNNPFTFTMEGVGVPGSAGGSLPAQDFWTGNSPLTRFESFQTAAIGAGSYDPLAHGGNYEGFVTGTGAGHPINGLLALRASRGNFSASATVGGVRHSLRGTFDADGNANGVTRDGTAFTLAVHNVTDGSGGVKIVGTFGADTIELVQSAFDRRSNPTDLAGAYTVVLPLNEDLGAGFPGGDGYGTVTIGADGKSRAALMLGDGTRVSQSGLVSLDGEWLFYKAVYRTGMLAGSIYFDEIPTISDFDGVMQWTKPLNARDSRYPNGFQIQQTLVGAIYAAPPRDARAIDALVDAADNVAITLSGGNLDLPGTMNATWDTSNRVTYTPVGTERLRFTVTARNGTVRGSYSERTPRLSTSFGGVIYQKQNLVSGTLIGDGETGRVLAVPDP